MVRTRIRINNSDKIIMKGRTQLTTETIKGNLYKIKETEPNK